MKKKKKVQVGSLTFLHCICLLDPGMELGSPELQADSLPTELFKARPRALFTEFSLWNLIDLDFCFTIYSVEKVSIQRNPNMHSCIDRQITSMKWNFFLLLFFAYPHNLQILVPWPGIETRPSTLPLTVRAWGPLDL